MRENTELEKAVNVIKRTLSISYSEAMNKHLYQVDEAKKENERFGDVFGDEFNGLMNEDKNDK